LTPVADYAYESANDWHAEAIPFACLDDNGAGDLLVAGAGRVRWDRTYETAYYPGLDPADFIVYSPNITEQWTVWTLDLTDPGAAWQPVATSADLGASRDITARKLAGVDNIVVGTPNGIYHYEGTGWTDIGFSLYNQGLSCWSLHLTCRGTLYAAMDRPDGGAMPSGVYRMSSVESRSPWEWIGDDTLQLPDQTYTLADIGMWDTAALIYLAVADGAELSMEPDVLYLGERTKGSNSYSGLYRCRADLFSPGNACTWEHKVYATGSGGQSYYWFVDGNGTIHPLDPGWISMWGTGVIFHPVVSPVDPERLLVHLNCRIHVSDDGGDTWKQRYTRDLGGYWRSRGYNELCVRGIAFMSDGRLVTGNGDCGTLRSRDTRYQSFEWIHPVVRGATDYTTDESWAYETAQVQVCPDWMGTGEDALFVNSGDYGQKKSPCKLFRVDGNDDWHNITNTYNTETMVIEDFVIINDDTCFAVYTEYDRKVTAGALEIDCGVLKGDYSPSQGVWTWKTVDDGLLFAPAGSPYTWNVHGYKLLFHSKSGRIFMAARDKVLSPDNAVIAERFDVTGGLYVLESPGDTTWALECGGDGTNWKDFRSLAATPDESVLYAGTCGRATGDGTVLRCDNPGSSPSTWVPIVNDVDFPFGFQVPFWAPWSEARANKNLTHVNALAVPPGNPGALCVGLACEGFMEKEGLWIYNRNGLGEWEHLSTGELMVGCGIRVMAFSPAHKNPLVAGTTGQELYLINTRRGGALPLK